MFERFTERARQVVVLAQEEARAFKHNYIGTEHILLGLLREEEGLAARVLESLDVTVERVRAGVVFIVGSGEEVTSGQIPFTPRAKKVLELALREALSLRHDYIGTEHILLGARVRGRGRRRSYPARLDASSEKIRIEVIRVLCGSGEEVTSGQSPSRSSPSADRELEKPDRVRAPRKGGCNRSSGLREGCRAARQGAQADEPQETNVGTEAGTATGRGVGDFTLEGARPVLVWERAPMLWRPEGLELRIPLHLGEGALARFAADEVWSEEPLASVRHEIWSGWLALDSPTVARGGRPDHATAGA